MGTMLLGLAEHLCPARSHQGVLTTKDSADSLSTTAVWSLRPKEV